MDKSIFSKKLTNTFGKNDNQDHRASFSRTFTNDGNHNPGSSLFPNQQRLGTDNGFTSRVEHTDQGIFRRAHPSIAPDNAHEEHDKKRLLSFGGAQLKLGSTRPSYQRPQGSNIFRKSAVKRDLGDLHSVQKIPDQNSNRLYTPKSGNRSQQLGRDEESTSKPRYNQTAVRNPTMQRSARLDQTQPSLFGETHQILQPKNSYVSPSFRAKRDETSEIEACHDGMVLDGHQLSSQQFQAAQMAVASRLTEQFKISDDISINDVDLQLQKYPSQKIQASYAPLGFFPTQSIMIPPVIKEIAGRETNWIVEVSKRNKVVYFGIGNKLVVWDFDQQVNASLMRNLQKNNGRQRLQAQNLQSKLVVTGQLSFSQEITCIMELKSRNLVTGWQKSGFAIPGCLNVLVATAAEIKLVHVRKAENCQSINVQESLIQPLSQILEPVNIMVELEKTGRVFFGGNDGHVSELVFQDYRNTLGGLMMNSNDKRRLEKKDHQSENFIAKMVPYVFKFKYDKQVQEIKIDEQRNMLYCLGNMIGGKGDGMSIIEVFFLGDLADQCRQLATIYLWQLFEGIMAYLGSTQAIYNKYVQAQEYQIKSIEPVTFAQSKEHHLMVVTKLGARIFLRFNEIEPPFLIKTDIERQGLQSDLIMTTNLSGSWEISAIVKSFPNDAEIHNEVNAREVSANFFRDHPIIHADNILQNRPLVDFIHTDNSKNISIYILDSEDSNPNWLKLCFLKQNDSSSARIRHDYLNLQQVAQSSSGCIPQLYSTALITDVSQNFDDMNIRNQRSQIGHEKVVKVQNCIPQMDLGLLASLGIEQPVGPPMYGRKNQIRQYFPTNDLERQVFLKGQQYHVLTSNRLIQISSLTPIEQLLMILFQIQRTKASFEVENSMLHFTDFAEKFGMSETCAMLIQLIADTKAEYNVYTRLQTLFALNSRDNLEMQQDSRYMQSHRMNASRASSIGLSRVKQGLQSSQSQSRSGILSVSLPRRGKFRRDQDNQEILSNLMEFNLEEPDQFVSVQHPKEILKLAFELLTTYGDSVHVNQVEELGNLDCEFIRGVEKSVIERENNLLFMYSNKHQGLYLYLYRLLQPIWETQITSQTNSDDIYSQVCNIDIFLPIRGKLQDLYDFLVQNQFNLHGKVYQGKELQTDDQCVEFLFNLNTTIIDYIEIAEKQSCIELKAFVRRCLDVIDFLEFTAQTREEFNMILRDLDDPMLQKLSMTSFKDFVNSDSNQLVRKILDITIRVNETGDPKRTIDLIRLRVKRAQNLCRTLFSPKENQVFIGESLLANSLREPDIQKKQKLMKEAMAAFKTDPTKVDIKSILPQLVQNQNYQMTLWLCVSQLEKLDPVKDISKIEDLYDIIVTMFAMYDKVISDYASAERAVRYGTLDPAYDGEHAMTFLQELVRLRDKGVLITNRSKFVEFLCSGKKWQVVGHLLKFFLLRDQSVDFLIDTVDHDVLNQHCESFINHQTQNQQFTKAQFEILKRIYQKKDQTASLSSLVVRVVTDQIVLCRQEADQYFENPLTCQERLDIVDYTSKLLADARRKFPDEVIQRQQSNSVQANGQTGSIVERQINLEKELEDCKVALKEQLAAIKSSKALVKILQARAAHNQQSQEELTRLENLCSLIALLDKRLMSVRELKNKYIQFEILDRLAYVAIHRVSMDTNKQSQEKMKQKQQDTLTYLIKETHKHRQSDEAFRIAIIEQIEMLYDQNPLNEHLLSSLLFYADQVRLVDPVQMDQLLTGGSWWLAEILFQKMQVKPSRLIKQIKEYEEQVSAKRLGTHVALMACFREWVKFAQRSNYQVTHLAQDAAIMDLKANGCQHFQDIILGYSNQWLKDNQLALSKKDYETFLRLWTTTREEFECLLSRLIEGYEAIRPEQQPQPQPQLQPKLQMQARRPVHAPESNDLRLQNVQKEDRVRQEERRNQSQRSFTPSRAFGPDNLRQGEDENQLMVDNSGSLSEVKPQEKKVSLVAMRNQRMNESNQLL